MTTPRDDQGLLSTACQCPGNHQMPGRCPGPAFCPMCDAPTEELHQCPCGHSWYAVPVIGRDLQCPDCNPEESDGNA